MEKRAHAGAGKAQEVEALAPLGAWRCSVSLGRQCRF